MSEPTLSDFATQASTGVYKPPIPTANILRITFGRVRWKLSVYGEKRLQQEKIIEDITDGKVVRLWEDVESER